MENESVHDSLWGANLYFDRPDFIEFTALINIRPAQQSRTDVFGFICKSYFWKNLYGYRFPPLTLPAADFCFPGFFQTLFYLFPM